MEQVLVVGESLVDVVRRDGQDPVEVPGGSAANAAVALARLGVPVSLATAFADDARGAVLRSHLEREGVRWACDPLALERTASAEAVVAGDGAASYTFDIVWRLNRVDDAESAVVLVSSLAPVLTPGDEQVLELVARRGRTAAVVYDVNARPAVTGTGAHLLASVQTMASLSDLVKASDEDLDVLMPGVGAVEAARHLLRAGAGAVVVTLGAEGSLWVDRSRVVEGASQPATVVDTIGAGDTFGAALVASLLACGALDRRPGAPDAPYALAEGELGEVLAWAGRAAAVTVSRPGADPPRAADLPRAPGPRRTPGLPSAPGEDGTSR